jgi:plasmid replication initiation protein
MKKDTNDKKNDTETFLEVKNYKVVKSNELIQKSRFNLNVQEQKIILYLISKIKPEDLNLKEYNFKITDFCRVCGLSDDSGGNYKYIKDTIKTLSDKSVWIEMGKTEKLLRWIYTAEISQQSGLIIIRISDDVKPYLLQLKEKFTQYELLYTLAMKSQYSIRLYEILKSYEYRHGQTFRIDELKKKLNAENYERYADFKRKVLDISMREINELSDLTVTYSVQKEGRKFNKINFSIRLKKNIDERLKTWQQIDLKLNGNKRNIGKNDKLETEIFVDEV